MCAARPTLDSVTTINADGSRRFLHPADVHGKWTRARRVAAVGLIAIYAGLPWIGINGAPAVFLDLASGQFHLFGATLFAADTWLLFFPVTGLGFGLFFLAAICGRLWCGWACPQTVFLEHVFRRIERLVDGDAPARRRLDAAVWDRAKVVRRAVKHALFVGIAAVIAHGLLAYFVSWPALYRMALRAPTEHWGLFVFVVSVTALLYFNFAWFREQLCIVICPYGRMQSALLDEHSIVVGYDTARGEPRGRPAAPPENAPTGDCVDCLRCVHVCPTGIDIRQGLQMECLGCTACIDACDDVMARLRRAPGLIRHDSSVRFAGGRTRWWRPRTVLYGALLAIGLGTAAWAMSTVRPVTVTPLRMPGGTYLIGGGEIRNQFLVRVANKTRRVGGYRFDLTGLPRGARVGGVGEEFDVPAVGEVMRVLVVRVPQPEYAGGFPFQLRLLDAEGGQVLDTTLRFRGPDPLVSAGSNPE